MYSFYLREDYFELFWSQYFSFPHWLVVYLFGMRKSEKRLGDIAKEIEKEKEKKEREKKRYIDKDRYKSNVV